MPKIQVEPDAQRRGKVGWRAAGALRRTAVIAGVIGLTAGSGLLSGSSALAASHGSEPGNLLLHPASGAASQTPTWSTKTGCPVGYQGSAEMSEFNTNGSFGSRISVTIPTPVAAFGGTLDGDVSSLFALGSNAKPGQTTEWAIGCYSLIAGTGKVKWVQSVDVTLSKDGKTYSTSAPTQSSGSATGSSATGQSVTAVASTSSGGGSQVEAALIAGACGLAVALGGVAIYRRRSRSHVS